MARRPLPTLFRYRLLHDILRSKRARLGRHAVRSKPRLATRKKLVGLTYEDLRSKGEILWHKGRGSVYRPSSILQLILRSYVNNLLDSHSHGKVHDWKCLESNIMFVNNDYERMSFYPLLPRRCGKDEFDSKEQEDFENLIRMMESTRCEHNLPEGNLEWNDFFKLLRNKSKAHRIKGHVALWGFEKRMDLIFCVQQHKEMEAGKTKKSKKSKPYSMKEFFNEKLTEKGKVTIALSKTNLCKFLKPGQMWWDLFKGNRVLEEVFYRKRYRNTFNHLVRFIQNVFVHATREFEGTIYTDAELEWMIYGYFPFYTLLLYQVLSKIGMYRLLSQD